MVKNSKKSGGVKREKAESSRLMVADIWQNEGKCKAEAM